MKIILDYTQDVHANASRYYEKAKESRKKREGVEKAIEETKKEMEKVQQEDTQHRSAMRTKREKKWHEKFHWFYTSGGKLAVGGKNAQENDLVVKKHMQANDLFFHADIQGGSAVILQQGTGASEQEKKEVAQFTASFSNAWKNGNAAVDVYAVRKDQLAKHVSGGYVGAGGFAIEGEREWFRSTPLGLKIGKDGGGNVVILPLVSPLPLQAAETLVASAAGKEKGEVARMLAKRLQEGVDELLGMLPAGRTKIPRR